MANEATNVDLKIYDSLVKDLGWVRGDSLLYQQQYSLDEKQQKEFGKKFIKPEYVLIDPIDSSILAVIENKLVDENLNMAQLRIDCQVLKPRFLYACSENRILFYDTEWTGLEAGEFKIVNSFMSYEDMKIAVNKSKEMKKDKTIEVDTSIAGGFDSGLGKERTYQLDCINTIIEKYKSGKQKMLIHMATGLGKTRTTVALCKALLSNGLAKKILFVVDRRTLARQARDDGFSLISSEYKSEWITSYNRNSNQHKDIHIVVIDTLEMIFDQIPSNYYDLIIVDECHRSISINRKSVLEHFICPKLGLTATPKFAIPKNDEVDEEDLAVLDTYKLFGCEDGIADYTYDLIKGIDNGFLAPYDVKEILTYLTQEAMVDGIPLDYVLDPKTKERLDLPKELKLKIENLEKKYISPERCMRIAEEIRKNTQIGEKVLLFGVSQAHCFMLADAINKVFGDVTDVGSYGDKRYAEAIVSDNEDINEYLKSSFKKPFEKPYVVTSVDIMSTGVDIPCLRYIGFAAITKSVSKYIQMIGRGSRLDFKKSGKRSFRVLDFVGLCSKSRMDDNGKGTSLPNEVRVSPKGTTVSGGGSEKKLKGSYFFIPNTDPESMITRTMLHGDEFEVIDNIPIDEARKMFEDSVKNTTNEKILRLIEIVKFNPDYIPNEEDLKLVEIFFRDPSIYLEESQLQKIYDFPQGNVWDFFLNALGIKNLPTIEDQIRRSYDLYIQHEPYTDEQLEILEKVKEVIISNVISSEDITSDTIFGNHIYEKIIGNRDYVESIFNDKFDLEMKKLKDALPLSRKMYR